MAQNRRIKRTKRSVDAEPERFGVVRENPDDPTSRILEFSIIEKDGSVTRVYMQEPESDQDDKPTIITLG